MPNLDHAGTHLCQKRPNKHMSRMCEAFDPTYDIYRLLSREHILPKVLLSVRHRHESSHSLGHTRAALAFQSILSSECKQQAVPKQE